MGIRWGFFVDHASLLEHGADVLAEDRVVELVVQTKAGWKRVARVSEVAVEGMSVARRHELRASWQLELDEHPGNELVALITGSHRVGDDAKPFARLMICRVDPTPGCGRIDVSDAKRVEVYAGSDLGVVVDGGARRSLASLDRADASLIGDETGSTPPPTAPAEGKPAR